MLLLEACVEFESEHGTASSREKVQSQMPKKVKPGEMVKLVFPLKAPNSTGDKSIIWAVRNADGVNFYPLYLKLNITE